eukprot:TRINITY_DN11742_c0_g1_i1.p3 TRINITY_DN11742_c0_g1~~TRINITY_DN11742_c0_g1_i1.p3  ORF type:complete len:127 (-),score=6.42 TRINITY_DN11742_c0_g1_i1:520-900(-)
MITCQKFTQQRFFGGVFSLDFFLYYLKISGGFKYLSVYTRIKVVRQCNVEFQSFQQKKSFWGQFLQQKQSQQQSRVHLEVFYGRVPKCFKEFLERSERKFIVIYSNFVQDLFSLKLQFNTTDKQNV